uniref:Glutathione peroxidase n=1 Tax=Gouania willdenowi TaxID=441366 RepID=A0A8C5GR34_GOUWI
MKNAKKIVLVAFGSQKEKALKALVNAHKSNMNVYNFSVEDQYKNQVSLKDYQGKVLLIVNTATKCGLTPQLKDLEKFYQKYQSQGFEILGFPCNQFFKQAPEEIEEFIQVCQLNFGVSFKQFNKINVNGKFLINKSGEVINRFAPRADFSLIERAIEEALQK